jgi:hypothetical protein
MKNLDLPAQRIPLHLFHRLATCAHRQVGDQFPVDPVPIWRRLLSSRLDHGNHLFRIAFLLALGGLNA